MLDSLAQGFEVAVQPSNLLYVFIGVLVGTVVGVLPGLGPTATIALLLPITYTLEPATAIIMLAGIYYGSMYGGTITSVLLKLPGEAASVITVIDGHEMVRQGRAGPALGIAALGSLAGGLVSIVGLILFAPALARIAVRIGPPEYVTLALVGLMMVAYIGTRSVVKSIAMAAIGLLLATVGQDPVTGTPRFTFGQIELLSGLDFIAIAMGLFGVGEILYNIEHRHKQDKVPSKVEGIWPTRQDFRDSAAPVARGSLVGFLLGILPGGGAVVSPLAAYSLEKKISKHPERFGHGAIEGVAAPETANNASATSAFIPLLTLGIPPNVVLALIYGALLIQGIAPGPRIVDDHPDVFWGVIASMVIGNLFLVFLNMPLVGLFVQVVRLRVGILSSFALLISMVGVYTVNNSEADMWALLVFGVLGWVMKKTGFEAGPLVLAFIIGAILEQSFRQSLLLSGGDLTIFLTRPMSAAVLSLVAAFVLWKCVGAARGGVSSRRSRTLKDFEPSRPDPAELGDNERSTP